MTLDEARRRVENMIGDSIWPLNVDLRDARLLNDELVMDGRFSADDLDAIAMVMRADRAADQPEASHE